MQAGDKRPIIIGKLEAWDSPGLAILDAVQCVPASR
jgi:hypothetical protein